MACATFSPVVVLWLEAGRRGQAALGDLLVEVGDPGTAYQQSKQGLGLCRGSEGLAPGGAGST